MKKVLMKVLEEVLGRYFVLDTQDIRKRLQVSALKVEHQFLFKSLR